MKKENPGSFNLYDPYGQFKSKRANVFKSSRRKDFN